MSIGAILWAGAGTIAGMWLAKRYDVDVKVQRRNDGSQQEMFGEGTTEVRFEDATEAEELGSQLVFSTYTREFLGWVWPSMMGWNAEYQRTTDNDTEVKRQFRDQDAAADWLVRRRRYGPTAKPRRRFTRSDLR
jgi:hypothetical protein